MHLRDTTPGDLDTIHVQNQANVPAVGDVGRAQMDWFPGVAAAFRVAAIDGAIAGFLIALRLGVAYGSVNYAWFTARHDDFYYIDRVAVDARVRQRGVARALYADAAARARTAGAPLLACEVNLRPRNDASLAFHAAAGFAEVGRQDTDGGARTVAMMTRSLAASTAGD